MSGPQTGALRAALAPHSRDAQAGFVAHLVVLAGADFPLDAFLEDLLEHFVEVAGLRSATTDDERHARMDAFYARVPIPAALMALLDATTEGIECETTEGAQRAARALTGETSQVPVGHTRVPGTMGGGIPGLLAIRSKPPT